MRAGIGGLEPAENLGAHRSQRAGGRTVEDADATIAIGIGFARGDLVLLPPEFRAERDFQRRFERGVELVCEFEIRRPLIEREFTVVETRAARSTERGVFRLRRHVVECVAAINRAEVPAPIARATLEPGAEGVVHDLGLNDREKTVRPDRAHRAVIRGPAEKAGTFRVLQAGAAEEVKLNAVGEREFAVEPGAFFFRAWVAVAMIEAVHRRFTRVERKTVTGAEARAGAVVTRGSDERHTRASAEVLLARVGLDAVGRAVIAEVSGEKQRAVLAELRAGKRVHCKIATVAALRGAIGNGGAPTNVFAEDDVDHARNGIGAVLRGSAVTQHFDGADGGRGDGVEIRRDRATADGAVEIDERTGVAAFAIDQHERLVGREAAQGRRADVIRAVRE